MEASALRDAITAAHRLAPAGALPTLGQVDRWAAHAQALVERHAGPLCLPGRKPAEKRALLGVPAVAGWPDLLALPDRAEALIASVRRSTPIGIGVLAHGPAAPPGFAPTAEQAIGALGVSLLCASASASPHCGWFSPQHGRREVTMSLRAPLPDGRHFHLAVLLAREGVYEVVRADDCDDPPPAKRQRRGKLLANTWTVRSHALTGRSGDLQPELAIAHDRAVPAATPVLNREARDLAAAFMAGGDGGDKEHLPALLAETVLGAPPLPDAALDALLARVLPGHLVRFVTLAEPDGVLVPCVAASRTTVAAALSGLPGGGGDAVTLSGEWCLGGDGPDVEGRMPAGRFVDAACGAAMLYRAHRSGRAILVVLE